MDEFKKNSMDEEIAGKAERLKGKVKEGVGRALDREDMMAEGEADQAAGKVRETIGKAGRNVSDMAERAKDAIRRKP